MKRNERTTIGKLVTGDRFYLMSDPEGQVWQIVEPMLRRRLNETDAKKDTDVRATSFKNNINVGFLRHSDTPNGVESSLKTLPKY